MTKKLNWWAKSAKPGAFTCICKTTSFSSINNLLVGKFSNTTFDVIVDVYSLDKTVSNQKIEDNPIRKKKIDKWERSIFKSAISWKNNSFKWFDIGKIGCKTDSIIFL